MGQLRVRDGFFSILVYYLMYSLDICNGDIHDETYLIQSVQLSVVAFIALAQAVTLFRM